MSEPLVRAEGLTKHFPVQDSFLARVFARQLGYVHAVDDVDLEIPRGAVYGLVGESGCGKTTLGRLLLRLLQPTDGRVIFDGEDVTELPERKLRPLRRRMQLVFQDPHASLNPAMTVGAAVAHPLVVHGLAGRREARGRAVEMLEEVGLTPPEAYAEKLPADLSGGERQRVVIARAMITNPDFVVCDEPVSMLDMSIRAKILDLLLDLRKRYGLTMLFITHDLATAKFMCDEMAIMYLGEVVEAGPAGAIYEDPKHPYTQSLLDAIPVPDPTRRREQALPRGEVPDATEPPAGCRFHPRCQVATPICGWSGRDLRKATEDRLLALDAAGRERVEALLGDPANWEVGPARVRVPVRSGGMERVAEAREEVRSIIAGEGDAFAGAVSEVAAEDGAVTVDLTPPEPIGMRRLPGDRRVLCVLYEDAAEGAEAPVGQE